MGLLQTIRRKVFGPTLRWECTDCGNIHSSNPKRCKECGNTILRQKREN